MSNHAASTRPPKFLSLESKAHRKARLFHTSGTWVPPQYSPSDRGLVRSAHAPARGGCQRARSFDSRITVSRPNAVGRDVIASLFSKSDVAFLSCNVEEECFTLPPPRGISVPRSLKAAWFCLSVFSLLILNYSMRILVDPKIMNRIKNGRVRVADAPEWYFAGQTCFAVAATLVGAFSVT